MEIVINRCYGGFGLSDKAYERLIELGMKVTKYKDKTIENKNADIVIYDDPVLVRFGKYSFVKGDYTKEIRTNSLVIQVVKELGGEADGFGADLKIVEIPDGIEYEITDYDGIERVEEYHNSWS